MARVQLDKTMLTVDSGSRVRVAPGRQLYILEPNGALDREIDPDDVEATETLLDVYTTESGGTTQSQPLTADAEGRFADCWVDMHVDHDRYSPTDSLNPIQRWSAPVAVTDVTPSLSNDWVASEGFKVYRVGPLVMFEGAVDAASASSDTICTLPAGSRPSYKVQFGGAWNKTIEVGTDGVVKTQAPHNNSLEYLTGLIFLAA